MAGPWEKYRQPATGPWAKYAQQPASEPEPTSSLEDFIAGTGAFAEPGSAPAPAPAMPVESQNVPLEDFLASDPSTLDQIGRAAQTNLQAVGRGLANIAGAPMDLTGAAIDLGLFGLEKAANTVLPEPVDLPRLGQMPLGSQHLKDSAGDLMAALGVDPIERENMHRSERFTGDALEFGTEATVAGLGLKKAADARFPGGNTKGVTPRTGDAFLAPYVGRGTAPVATDTAAGVGAGIGYNFADENFPDSDEAKLIAMLLGGAGGAVASDVPGMVSGTVSAIDGMRPSNAPYGEGGLAPVSRRTVQHTRNFLEEALTDPAAARDAVKARFDEAQRTGDVMPTTGIASDDIGLVALEKGSRVKNPVPFEEADQRLVDSAQQKITGLRDPEADLTAPAKRAEQVRQERLAPVAAQRDAAEAELRQAEASRQAQGAPLRNEAGSEARDAASSRVHSAVEDPYIKARTAKNAAFDAIDPSRTIQVDAADVIDVARKVRSDINELAPSGLQMPGEFIKAMERLAPDIRQVQSSVLDASGNPVSKLVNVGGTGTAALGDLVEVRKYLSTAQENAQRSGNFTLADSIATLRRTINQTIERSPSAAEANEQYRQFADRFRPDRADEGAKFTREIDRGKSPAPSKTARRFLSTPERTKALRRMAQGADAAGVRDYLRSEFASRALASDGTIDPARASAWVKENSSTLSSYPQLRREIETIAAQASRGESISKAAKTRLEAAAKNLSNAERSFERSVISDLAATDPRNVAKRMLGDEYGTETMLKEVNEALKANPDAQRGWKAAVAEVLVDKVTNTNTALTRSAEGPLSIAKLQKVWKRHEKDLANIFTPEEMAAANRAHEILEPLGNLARKSTTGSPTATNQQLTNALEAGVLAYTGNAIQTGMIMRRLKVAANLVPGAQDLTLESKMNKLVERMWFDPELFIHVMDQPVKQGTDKAWNARLNRLIAGTEYVKADEEPSEDEQLQNMIMEGAQ